MKLRLFWKIYTFLISLLKNLLTISLKSYIIISKVHITMFQKNQISPSFKQKIYRFV